MGNVASILPVRDWRTIATGRTIMRTDIQPQSNPSPHSYLRRDRDARRMSTLVMLLALSLTSPASAVGPDALAGTSSATSAERVISLGLRTLRYRSIFNGSIVCRRARRG